MIHLLRCKKSSIIWIKRWLWFPIVCIKNTAYIIFPIPLRQKPFSLYSCLSKNLGSNGLKHLFHTFFSGNVYQVTWVDKWTHVIRKNMKYLSLFFALCNCIIVKLIHSKSLVTYQWNLKCNGDIKLHILHHCTTT